MSDSIQIAAAAVELVETNVTSTAGKNVILLNSKAKAEETVAVGDQENNANGEIKSPTTKALTEAEVFIIIYLDTLKVYLFKRFD